MIEAAEFLSERMTLLQLCLSVLFYVKMNVNICASGHILDKLGFVVYFGGIN